MLFSQTRIGRFIRKASIDELPQLWNVWVGEMSFDEQVQLDIRDIHKRSLWLDIRLLFATVPADVLARGAY
ncbi:MAG: lipopolysaccharide/colanic/teichoic acid biosynthesis glycosyltransferase [Glaciecola sp.]